MKGITALQWGTLGTFIGFVIIGIAVLVVAPERMGAYSELLGSLWPLFVAEVIPAFLGTTLKEYVKSRQRTGGGNG